MTKEEKVEEPVVEEAKREEEDPKTEPAAPSEKTPKFTVCLVAARGLRNADWLPGAGKPDCFCELKVAGKEDVLHKTQVINNTLEPIWEEEVEICDWEVGEKLEFSVYDEDAVGRDFLGKALLDSKKFEKGFNDELKLDKGPTSYIKLKLKMAGKDYPKGPPAEFKVNIERAPKQKTLGLDLDIADETYLYVTAVNPGPFEAFNKSKAPAEQLKASDFIISCNGATGSSKAILEELKSATAIELVVRRQAEHKVIIDKKPHGLEFGKLAGKQLLITSIGEGPVAEWNAKHQGTEKEVRKNDRIVAVGALRGEAKQLQARMKSASFQITVARPADPEVSTWWKF